ncbi:dsDNA-mimic protein [Aliidiomarina taiwanensis]|uniref:DsDNA-mimic protein n=1 Tax=Aliidiomarina taiwanensis TaxID=946228 RepID=A0A432WTQ8_9GAMM|nr:dsDNA-mimic protein [Aliidiomarina taiwanensis]
MSELHFTSHVERPLVLKEKVALKFHLMMCAGCYNFNTHMHDLRKVTRTYAKGSE